MTKPKPDITDPRTLAVESLKRLGGIEGFVKWGKSHRTLYYALYAKLMAQPATTTFNNNKVTIKVEDGNDAKRRLETAYLNIINARRISGADPAVFVDGARIDSISDTDGISNT